MGDMVVRMVEWGRGNGGEEGRRDIIVLHTGREV